MIVAAGRDGSIGREGNLIWRIPADLRRFKALTMGHPVIMGRKTWESLPKRPLPGRTNIVVTRNESYEAPGALIAASPEEALRQARKAEEESEAHDRVSGGAFVMGGAELYNAFMPLTTRIFLTEIDAECQEADAAIPYPLDPAEWEIEEALEPEVTPDGVGYRYVTYRRAQS